MILVAHNIRSLHNVGSLFRTAECAGVEKVYLTGYTPNPRDRFGAFRADVVKVALGAEKTVPYEHRRDIRGVITALKRAGYAVFGLEQHATALPYYKRLPVTQGQRRKLRYALIVGNEVRGLSSGVTRQADAMLEIPMYGAKESLNVSVAAGVALFRLLYPVRSRDGSPR